jgi:hemerythrin-like metal-binding protein
MLTLSIMGYADMRLLIQRLEWSEAYRIGHPVIDGDHMALFAAVNELISAVRCRDGTKMVVKTLEAMQLHAVAHFEQEEVLMRNSRYHGYAYHTTCHEGFTAVIAEFGCQFANGIDVSEEIAFFLREWLEIHILTLDMRLAQFIRPTESA